MADLPPADPEPQVPQAALYQARITTATGQAMLDLLEGREVELVGRGPHQRDDGSYAAEIIASRHVMDDLSEAIDTLFAETSSANTFSTDTSPRPSIQVRAPRETPAQAVQLSKHDRYREDGSVPRGVGVKE